MIVYLNGCDDNDELGKLKIKINLPPIIKKIVTTVNKIIPPKLQPANVFTKVTTDIKDGFKSVVAEAKKAAVNIGAGVKRLVSIPQNLANKAMLRVIETNMNGMATRIRDTYKIDPNGLKQIVSQNKIPWSDFTKAVNKGVKNVGAISGIPASGFVVDRNGKIVHAYMGDAGASDDGGSNTGGDGGHKYASWAKAAVGIIKQIIAWFKKHKKNNKADDEIVEQMALDVDADPTYPKFDENGNLLPNADGSLIPEKSGAGAVLGLGAAALAAKVLLFS